MIRLKRFSSPLEDVDYRDYLIFTIKKFGNLDYIEGFTSGWEQFESVDFYEYWHTLEMEDKQSILKEAKFTGLICNEEFDEYGTMFKRLPRKEILYGGAYIEDNFGDTDFLYVIKFDDGTKVDSCDLEPQQKIPSLNISWICGGGGFAHSVYYAKTKESFVDICSYMDADVWVNGVNKGKVWKK